MELQITGTNIQMNPAMQRYIERKMAKLNKHLPGIQEIKVETAEEKTKSPQQRYLVKVAVSSGLGGVAFHGEERGEDLFKAVDRVVSVMTRQMERRKGKLYSRGRGNPMARGRFNQNEEPEPKIKVVKTKRFIIEAMSLDEAIEQMERLGHEFFLYKDSKSEEPRVLYRRHDGNYGIIEPEFK
jgi:putative sigma-54 modulation protein